VIPVRLFPALFLAVSLLAAEKSAVFPKVGPKPVGPYTPGVMANDVLYVSGQGARDANNQMAPDFEGQTRQCLENVKAIVEGGGLSMADIVYSQVYLADMKNYPVMDKVWKQYFPGAGPVRAVLGVKRMPTETPVEINAVVTKKSLDRTYIPGLYAATPAAAMDLLKKAVPDLGNLVFLNVYVTPDLGLTEMNQLYATLFAAGDAPARASLVVNELPNGAKLAITGVAVKDRKDRRVVRPRNMAPSRTASPCVWAGDTLYCSAKSGFIPGPNSGIYGSTVELQVRQTMRNLLDGLEEAGLNFSHCVQSNVYVDDLAEFGKMNGIYGSFFPQVPPTRTTVQPLAPVERKEGPNGTWPMLEQVSVVAVRPSAQ
jgi:reactive intermediate/imine deaminase